MPAGITYAGIPLCQQTPDVAAWVEANISPRDVYEWALASWPGHNRLHWTWPGFVPDRPVKVGSLYWPKDAARWAVGHFLCTSGQLTGIRKQVFVNGAPIVKPLVLDDGRTGRRVTANLWMLPARPLAQIQGSSQLYLLTLVDERFWWWMPTGPTLIEVGTGSATWQSMFADVVGALGATSPATLIGPPGAYLGPCGSLTSQYDRLPLLLDSLARDTGTRVVRGLLSGTTLQSPGVAAKAVVSQLAALAPTKQAGGTFVLGKTAVLPVQISPPQDVGDAPALVPSSVLVTFPRNTPCEPCCGVYTVEVPLTSLALADYANVVGHGGKQVFHDTCNAQFTRATDSTPANAAELASLANQIARDWYSWRMANIGILTGVLPAWAPADVKFAGIIPWTPEGMHDAVEWRLRDDEVSTRLYRPAWNDPGEELHHASQLYGCRQEYRYKDSFLCLKGSSIGLCGGSSLILEGTTSVNVKPGGTLVLPTMTAAGPPQWAGICVGEVVFSTFSFLAGGGTLWIWNGAFWVEFCECGFSGSGSGSGGGVPSVSVPCCANLLPATLTATFYDAGGCPDLEGVAISVVWDDALQMWQGTLDNPCGAGGLCKVTLACGSGTGCNDFVATADGACKVIVMPAPSAGCSCNPLYLAYSVTIGGSCCFGGSATLVFTP